MKLTKGQTELLTSPTVGSGLKHWLSFGSDHGDAKIRVAVWRNDGSEWRLLGDPIPGSEEKIVTVKRAGDIVSYLLDVKDRKVSVRVEEADKDAVVGVGWAITRAAS